MRIGFIGTGAISSSIVRGLCSSQLQVESIWISPRNKDKSRNLNQEFELVKVGDSNQTVLDQSDVVVLGILPQHMKSILNDLTFRSDQTVVHLLAGIKISEVTPLIEPAKQIVRVVPLPCVAIHKGPIVIFPRDETAFRLFEEIGSVIVVESEEQLESLSIITALMAPYYSLVETVVSWAEKEGIKRKNASDYTASMFEALSLIAGNLKDGNLNLLINESMTPNGLNELAMKTLDHHGGFQNLMEALLAVKKRVS